MKIKMDKRIIWI